MTEEVQAPGRRLGRRAPSNKPALMLGPLLTGVVPVHPVAVDHFSLINDWGLWANDIVGDCGPVSVGNSRKLISSYLTGVEQQPTLDEIYDLYRRSGNPDFDPRTGTGDDGVDMQTMLSAVNKAPGFAGTTCAAFAKVDVSNLSEVRAAIAIFGFVLFGVDLDTAQQGQTDTSPPLWDYSRSGSWGGHAIVAGAYTSSLAAKTADISVVSWAEVVGCTDTFLAKQLSEAWVVIWPEHLLSKSFLEGVDVAAMGKAYEDLTGRPFPAAPVPITPTPPVVPPVVPPVMPPPPVDPPVVPPPVGPVPPGPTPADLMFETAALSWLRTKPWFYKPFQKQLQAWLAAQTDVRGKR